MASPTSEQFDMIASARNWYAITPHDSNPLPSTPRAISNEGTSGTVTLIGANGVEATFYIAQGQERALSPRIVKATGMTAGMALRALG